MDKSVAVLGSGTIGAGWVARLVTYGFDVAAFDQMASAESRCREVMQQAATVIPDLGTELPPAGSFRFATDLSAAVAGADFVIECLPEDLELKTTLYHQIEPLLAPDALLLSSTSGFKPSVLGDGLAKPSRLMVCHPFNPVYLIPLVEVVPHATCQAETRDNCLTMLRSIGMRPLLVRHEVDGHIADRLLEAMWREALWLINDNQATTGEIDDAIKYGFGLRMAHMGLFETYRLGGGEGGFKQFLAQFGPALQWPWSHLTNVPELDDTLVDKIVQQSDEQIGEQTHAELTQERDRKLVAILKATEFKVTNE